MGVTGWSDSGNAGATRRVITSGPCVALVRGWPGGVAPAKAFAVAGAKPWAYLRNMQTSPDAPVMLGLLGLGGGEIVLILALVLILFGAKKLPELAKGLGEGISRFRDAFDDTTNDAGRSVGGIYGKRAAQAITPDNNVAELYNPAVFQRRPKRRRGRKNVLLKLWQWIRARVGWR